MKLKSMVLMMVAVLATTAWGQGLSKAEFTGGYTYTSLDQNFGFGSAGRLSAPKGWNTGGSVFINKWLGLEGNIAGLSKSESASITSGGVTLAGSASENHYTFVFGPRMSFGQGRMNPFIHALFGLDRMTLSESASLLGVATNVSASNSAFATAIGGGMEYGIVPPIGLVTGADYLMTRHGLPSSLAGLAPTGSTTQNNFRVQAGMAFRFGSGWEAPKR